jgi:hypothetical protein
MFHFWVETATYEHMLLAQAAHIKPAYMPCSLPLSIRPLPETKISTTSLIKSQQQHFCPTVHKVITTHNFPPVQEGLFMVLAVTAGADAMYCFNC